MALSNLCVFYSCGVCNHPRKTYHCAHVLLIFPAHSPDFLPRLLLPLPPLNEFLNSLHTPECYKILPGCLVLQCSIQPPYWAKELKILGRRCLCFNEKHMLGLREALPYDPGVTAARNISLLEDTILLFVLLN